MPKKAINYDNCLIYKLVCLDTTYPEVYVGSTTNYKQRKSNHKSKCKNDKCKEFNYKVYQYMREHGGFENFAMIEIEKFPCENGRQLEAREEHWRKELNATLNGQQAFTTEDEIKDYMKEYYETHKDELKAYMKAYRTTHKEELKQQKKEYDKANWEKKLQRQKKYYNNHKDKINQHMKEYRLRKKLEKKSENEIPETIIIEN